MKKILDISIAMVGILFLLLSCKDEPPATTPPPVPAKPVVRAKKQNVKAVPTKTQEIQKDEDGELDISLYDTGTRRDPFKPFLVEKPASKIVEESKPKTPLQKYNINELKLVAIIWGMGRPTAMVEDPVGKGYILKKGMLIGDRNGKVVNISKNRVVVKEKFNDILGDIQEGEVILELPKPEEEELK